MTEKDYALNFDEILKKLESACRKVWDEDRVSAVALQAVTNEVASAFRRAGEAISSMRQEFQTKESVIRRECEARIEAAKEKQDAATARAANVEEEWVRAKAKIETLLKELEVSEEEYARFQEKHLRIEAQKDSERADHMEKFIEEENAKEHERELFWKQRHHELETELKLREREFERRHRDLLEEMQRSAEETSRLYSQKEAKLAETQRQLDEEYLGRETALHEREREYIRKCEELEKLKQNLRAEITELTREYPRKNKENPESR